MMRAIRQHAFGGPEELRLEEMPDPRPAGDQVRIRAIEEETSCSTASCA
ncbi:hypothetical protein [Actinomadura opuntiae]|nr:hypothetical protein [Actinomadura sp. OS1-43]MDL4814006.1 hypothetical protein [Actinomadura sp. OS1-43]